jgi:restriction system protein
MGTAEKAILSNREAAKHPQPIDYGLTYYDLHLRVLGPLGLEKPRDALRYKEQGKWLNFLGSWKFPLAIAFVLYIFVSPYTIHLFLSDGRAVGYFIGMVFPVFWATVLICLALRGIGNSYKRRHPSPGLSAYKEALRLHELYVAAAREAEEAARKAEQELLRRKRSYWERLNGYEFEMATAEVLKRHQLNPRVTGGSADGGVDIEVRRGGRKGVVQCKAHVACVGPHTVRDLFGVMHHSSSDFGIIVSRGGFTKGAIDFARNKPIFLVDTSDLIAMQEGQDVLAGGFLTT